MSIRPNPQLGTDIWTDGGPWRFTREATVVGAAPGTLYSFYHRAFEPLKVRAAVRRC